MYLLVGSQWETKKMSFGPRDRLQLPFLILGECIGVILPEIVLKLKNRSCRNEIQCLSFLKNMIVCSSIVEFRKI